MNIFKHLQKSLLHFPSPAYLGISILIFATSNSVTRKIVEIGEANPVNGHNPISLCNVLFVGNLCALALMLLIFYQDINPKVIKLISKKDWVSLTVTGILSGAIAPALVFSALGQTNVANIVLIGRIEPLLSLVLAVFLLKTKLDRFTVVGSLISFAGIAVTVFLNSSKTPMMGGLHLGTGEIFVAIAAVIGATSNVISKIQLQSISIGFFSIYRNILGTIFFFFLAILLYGPQHFAEVLLPLLWQWMIVYAAVIVVIGKITWLAGLKDATTTQLNLANLASPILAIAMAYFILGEVPTFAQYLGGILLILGLIFGYCGNAYQEKSKQKAVTIPPKPREVMEMEIGFRGV